MSTLRSYLALFVADAFLGVFLAFPTGRFAGLTPFFTAVRVGVTALVAVFVTATPISGNLMPGFALAHALPWADVDQAANAVGAFPRPVQTSPVGRRYLGATLPSL
ncbi:hypothetical protein BIY45_01095 [Stenotrophomonas sp. BIIR7]|nr:hypothetical protein BIY45_01095 [Stenotrophomonas sp. BIIR7]